MSEAELLERYGAVPASSWAAPSALSIPLCARDGTVRAYAMVDAADHPWLSEFNWHRLGGYAARTEGSGRKILMHRQILGLEAGDSREGDHRDRDKLNCQRSNLRVLTRAQNAQNVPSHADGTSRFRGVYRNRGKWVAMGRLAGRGVHIGRYDSEQEAADAAAAWRRAHMPSSTD